MVHYDACPTPPGGVAQSKIVAHAGVRVAQCSENSLYPPIYGLPEICNKKHSTLVGSSALPSYTHHFERLGGGGGGGGVRSQLNHNANLLAWRRIYFKVVNQKVRSQLSHYANQLADPVNSSLVPRLWVLAAEQRGINFQGHQPKSHAVASSKKPYTKTQPYLLSHQQYVTKVNCSARV